MSEETPKPRRRLMGGSLVAIALQVARQRRAKARARAEALVQTGDVPAARYTATAKLLHWLVALLVLVQVPLGVVMKRAGLALETQFWLYQLHKSLGLTVLILMLMRVFWRTRHAPPPLPPAMPLIERGAAHLNHLVLYALLIALPVTGWLMVSASVLSVPTRFFDWVEVPHFPPLAALEVPARSVYERFFKDLHSVTAFALAGLIVLHVAAALRHHWSKKDAVLSRMLPGHSDAL